MRLHRGAIVSGLVLLLAVLTALLVYLSVEILIEHPGPKLHYIQGDISNCG